MNLEKFEDFNEDFQVFRFYGDEWFEFAFLMKLCIYSIFDHFFPKDVDFFLYLSANTSAKSNNVRLIDFLLILLPFLQFCNFPSLQ